MRVLAIEHEVPPVAAAAFTPALLRAEAARVWELQQSGALREIWFRQDRHAAVLILEGAGAADVQRTLATLPLVAAGLITFEVIPLVPYPGLARLFAQDRPASGSVPGAGGRKE